MTAFENMRLVAEGLEFPEGPVAMPDGSVLVVEIKGRRISRVAPDGTVETVAETGGGPNGMAIGPDGRAYVCNNGGFVFYTVGPWTISGEQPPDYSGGRIERVDLATGAVEALYTECGGNRLRGPNDIVFDANGDFWFTDHGKLREREADRGGVYWAKADGSEVKEVVFPCDFPNGVGLSPDGRRLYYAETYTGRVWQRWVTGPGEVMEQSPVDPSLLLAGLPGYQLLDSLAVDGEGHVCVGTLVNPPGVSRISPDGQVDTCPLEGEWWDPLPTNICFGGPDLRTAYITLSGTGRLVACDWPVPGLPPAFSST